jgi:hypothetical protein
MMAACCFSLRSMSFLRSRSSSSSAASARTCRTVRQQQRCDDSSNTAQQQQQQSCGSFKPRVLNQAASGSNMVQQQCVGLQGQQSQPLDGSKQRRQVAIPTITLSQTSSSASHP